MLHNRAHTEKEWPTLRLASSIHLFASNTIDNDAQVVMNAIRLVLGSIW